jgi:hypothetical protein
MLEIAQLHNLFDEPMYSIYKEVKTMLERLKFIEPMCSKMSSYSGDEKMVDAMKDLFKYYKQKIDWKNYKIALNEEPIAEEILTEEAIEELIED